MFCLYVAPWFIDLKTAERLEPTSRKAVEGAERNNFQLKIETFHKTKN